MNFFSKLIKNVRNFFVPKKPRVRDISVSKPTKETTIAPDYFPPLKDKEIKVETIDIPDIKDETNSRIDEIKRQFQESIIDKANLRWKRLEELGLSSSAIYRALEDNNNISYFDIEKLDSYNDILAEVTRARVFLNDFTSSEEGARLFTQEEKAANWKGKFGNQYNNWVYSYKNYDKFSINEDYAKVAFRLYRDLEGSNAEWLQRYGSGESIALIYEMVQDLDLRDKDNNDELDMARVRLDEFFQQKYGAEGRVLERQFDERNENLNFVYNDIKYRNMDLEQYDLGKTYF